MIKNRKKIEVKILKYIKQLAGKENEDLYIKLFKGMTNPDFHAFMEGLRDNKFTLAIIVPNGGKIKLNTRKNLKVCRELGYEPFQKTVVKIPNTNIETLSNVESLVLYMPLKRLSQHMTKGVSYAEHMNSRNFLTGQVANASRSAKITSKELNIYLGKGYDSAMTELMLARSGDGGATNAMNAFIEKYGEVSIDEIKRYSTKSDSTKTLKSYFKAMHIDINI